MLQQTQTLRVIPYWKRWMAEWPRPEALAAAPLEEVLRAWSGLGYNRRARALRDSAARIARDYGGKTPEKPEVLLSLPGIGPYTAGAVACFAYNYPSVFIETNIRAVIIHFYFQGRNQVSDKEIFPVLESVMDRKNPRRWYYAMMDYGAALKSVTVNPNRRSAHYARQSRFEGSFRQIRGRALHSLVAQGPAGIEELGKRTGLANEDLYKALEALRKDSMVAEKDGIYLINDK
jgi:A/G-specific adenine glycosylase